MIPISAGSKEVPLKLVTSCVFGRYPKISVEKVYNMIQSDNFMVPYAGHMIASSVPSSSPNAQSGRGIYSSIRGGFVIWAVGDVLYTYNNEGAQNVIGNLSSYSGDVFFAENEKYEIAICDLFTIQIYNYETGIITQAFTSPSKTLDFIPGYIAYQDGRFISVDSVNSAFRLGDLNNSALFPTNLSQTIQTKGDTVVAAVPVPSRSSLLLVMGSVVGEYWTDQGLPIFPYQKITSINNDYGCLNVATIASSDEFTIWLAGNDNSGPVIMYNSGGSSKRISNDGIDFLFSELVNPSNSYGFIFKQDGHLLYQLTFADPADNFTLVYDFNTSKFFFACDQYMNRHIAKKVVFFNDGYYFISFIDGSLYQMGTQFTTFNSTTTPGQGTAIPRIILTPNLRSSDTSRFRAENFTFTIEQGQSNALQRIDVSFSIDGGYTFGSEVPIAMNVQANLRNKIFQRMGFIANDLVGQFKFWGTGRFMFTDGVMSISQ